MSSTATKILLVEDNPGDARLIREMLAEAHGASFEIDWVPQLSAALEKLERGNIDLVLLDLGLPDSRGLNTFFRAYAHAPQIPFVVLTGLDDETLALSALRHGAQDYLVKGQTDGGLLLRAIRYATERKRIEEELRLSNEELRREIEVRRAAELAVEAERQRLYALLDEIPGMVHLKTADFSIQFANRFFRETFGDWEGKYCFELMMDRTEPCENCPALRVFQTWLPTETEWTAAKTKQTYQIHHHPFADVGGPPMVLTLGIDITQRKRAEEALETERRQLYSLLDGLPGLVYLKAPDYSLRFANRLFREICGDWEGKKCFEAMFNREQPCENCTQFLVLETGEPSVKEATFAESKQTYQVYSYPFADVDGSSLVLTLGIDVTQRKQAEEALRQSEARLAKAQQMVHLGHWEWDLETQKVLWSEEVFRIFGLDPEEFTPTLAALMRYVHPEDQERVSQALEDAVAGMKPYNLVSRLVRPDGSTRYVHSQAEAVFDATGKPQRIVGTALDITERRTAEMRLRESEERFRAVFEAAAIGIGLTDMQGRFLTANKIFQGMVGYEEQELRGMTFVEFTHPDDVGKNRKLFQELEFGQRDYFQMEKRYRRKDGQYFWGRVTVSLVKDFEGQPVYTIGMVEDITQAKEAEEKLQESEKSLRILASQLITAQEDERQRISQELHDELGQSLLVLKLQAGFIEKELGQEQQRLRQECREMLANFDKTVENVRRLSRDLSPTIIEDLGLSAALRHLIGEFCKHYQIECRTQETNIDDLVPLATQIVIYRIVQESLTNIGKHSQAKHLLVAIDKDDLRVSFLIQDDGKGFDPALQLSQRWGMGLAAMEERARMVGGTLSIWSQEGAGTRISLNIPYFAKPK